LLFFCSFFTGQVKKRSVKALGKRKSSSSRSPKKAKQQKKQAENYKRDSTIKPEDRIKVSGGARKKLVRDNVCNRGGRNPALVRFDAVKQYIRDHENVEEELDRRKKDALEREDSEIIIS